MKNYCGGEMLSTYLKVISARNRRRRPNNIGQSYSQGYSIAVVSEPPSGIGNC